MPLDAFKERDSRGRGEAPAILTPAAFLQKAMAGLGIDGTRDRSALAEDIDIVVAYLAEGDAPDAISVRKLGLALTAGDRDSPLPQSGIEDVKSYQADIRAKAASADMPKGTPAQVAALATWMQQPERGFDVGDLFKGAAKNGEMRTAAFTQALAAAGYKKDSKELKALVEALAVPGPPGADRGATP